MWQPIIEKSKDLATRYKLGTLTTDELRTLRTYILTIEKELKIQEHPERPDLVRLDFARSKAESLHALGL